MFGAGSAVTVSSYQNFTVAAESVEKQSPQLRPTHTIGRDCTHMAGPDILHPGQRVGGRSDVKGCVKKKKKKNTVLTQEKDI